MSPFEFDQLSIIKTVQSLAGPETRAHVDRLFTAQSAHRVELYQRSYLGRLVGNIAASVLEQLARVFGKQVLLDVLVRFFTKDPPSSILLTESIIGLADFVRNSGSSLYHELFATLVELSIAAWDLVHGCDPSPIDAALNTFEQAFLKGPFYFHKAKAAVDLFAAWVAAQQTVVDTDQFINHIASGVLLVKTSPLRSVSIRVLPSLEPLVEGLKRGWSVHKSIMMMPAGLSDLIDTDDLSEFLQALDCEDCLCHLSYRSAEK